MLLIILKEKEAELDKLIDKVLQPGLTEEERSKLKEEITLVNTEVALIKYGIQIHETS
jgi:hypothetical protein